MTELTAPYTERFQFKINQRVKLKGDIAPNFYAGYGCTGNEGWVRNHRFDEYGYPEVYIEWDQKHWAYNGVPDGWTYENHFEEAEHMARENPDEEKTQEDILQAAFREFLKDHPGILGEPPKEEDFGEEAARRVEETQQREEYTSSLQDAMENAKDAEAFIMVVVQRHDSDTAEKGILAPVAWRYSMNSDAAILLGMQVARLAQQYHNDTGLALIHRLAEEED